jgi:hypothetical protein
MAQIRVVRKMIKVRLAKADFKESDHPRAADGKFGSGSGSSDSGAKDAPAPKAERAPEGKPESTKEHKIPAAGAPLPTDKIAETPKGKRITPVVEMGMALTAATRASAFDGKPVYVAKKEDGTPYATRTRPEAGDYSRVTATYSADTGYSVTVDRYSGEKAAVADFGDWKARDKDLGHDEDTHQRLVDTVRSETFNVEPYGESGGKPQYRATAEGMPGEFRIIEEDSKHFKNGKKFTAGYFENGQRIGETNIGDSPVKAVQSLAMFSGGEIAPKGENKPKSSTLVSSMGAETAPQPKPEAAAEPKQNVDAPKNKTIPKSKEEWDSTDSATKEELVSDAMNRFNSVKNNRYEDRKKWSEAYNSLPVGTLVIAGVGEDEGIGVIERKVTQLSQGSKPFYENYVRFERRAGKAVPAHPSAIEPLDPSLSWRVKPQPATPPAPQQPPQPATAAGAKEPWEMSGKEWGTAREGTKTAGIAGQAYKPGASGAAMIEHLTGGVHNDAKKIIAEHAAAVKQGIPSPHPIEHVQAAAAQLQRPVTHKDVIQNALKQGKSVPSEVLAEYPDLAPQPPAAEQGQGTKPEEAEGPKGPVIRPGKPIPAPTATGGKVRQIGGNKYDTAEVVNNALIEAQKKEDAGQLDLKTSESMLRSYGHKNPTPELIHELARQNMIQKEIDAAVPGANTGGQVGKWKFDSAQTIHDNFNSYLERRIQGQKARWTQKTKKY